MTDSNQSSETPQEPKKSKYRFDPSDGIDMNDFLGIFVGIYKFFKIIVLIIISPLTWIFNENIRMIKFFRAETTTEPMNTNEKLFFESIPTIFTITGLTSGLILGIFVAISLRDTIDQFFRNINFIDFFYWIGDIIRNFWFGIVWIFTQLDYFFNSLSKLVTDTITFVQTNSLLAFIVLFLVGLVVIILFVVFNETKGFDFVINFVSMIYNKIIGSPELFKIRMINLYRKFNHLISRIVVGEERLNTRTLQYFQKVTWYTILGSAWAYLAGLIVAINNAVSQTNTFDKVAFVTLVLFSAGFISGLFLLGLFARLLDVFKRGKYIAESTKGGSETAEA